MMTLVKIQNELKAPKSQFNSFGKYNYRNVEDILEAVKPLLLENSCKLTLTDEMVEVGGRVYVKATATFIDMNSTSQQNYKTEVSSFAREAEDKKGMDSAQVTGSTSSYARKYALNGLFLIDDTKDSDFTNQTTKENKNTNQPPRQEAQRNTAQAATQAARDANPPHVHPDGKECWECGEVLSATGKVSGNGKTEFKCANCGTGFDWRL